MRVENPNGLPCWPHDTSNESGCLLFVIEPCRRVPLKLGPLISPYLRDTSDHLEDIRAKRLSNEINLVEFTHWSGNGKLIYNSVFFLVL